MREFRFHFPAIFVAPTTAKRKLGGSDFQRFLTARQNQNFPRIVVGCGLEMFLVALVVYAGLKKQNHKSCFRAATIEICLWNYSNFAVGNSSATTWLLVPVSPAHLEAANYAIEGTFQASEASHLFGIQKHRKLGYNTEVKILRGSHGWTRDLSLFGKVVVELKSKALL